MSYGADANNRHGADDGASNAGRSRRCLIQQQKHRDQRDDREQKTDKLMLRLDKGIINRVVDDGCGQKRQRAGDKELAARMHEAHAVTYRKSRQSVRYPRRKAADQLPVQR